MTTQLQEFCLRLSKVSAQPLNVPRVAIE